MSKDDLSCFVSTARRAADMILEQRIVLLVSHIDADGISAAGIASTALDRLGIEHECIFAKSIDPETSDLLRSRDMFVWLTDLGSSSLGLLSGIRGVISDHHIPDNPVSIEKRGNILAYSEYSQEGHPGLVQVNPHFFGRDGTSDLSGAGATFALGLALSQENADLAPLAIVGAVGDMQDKEGRGLVGLNRDIALLGESMGLLSLEKDIRFFGRETRGLSRFLLYGLEKPVPGLDVEEGVVEFLRKLDVKMEDRRGRWRVWVDLSISEKRRVISALEEYLEKVGMALEIACLQGEVYSLLAEKPGSGFYDAKEFATMLNSCGRYDRGDLGLRLAKGDRKGALREAADMRRGHRKNLVSSLDIVRDMGVEETPHLMWFNAGNRIRDTVVGTVAGMYMKSICGEKPMMAFANIDDVKVKASIRCTQSLVDRGLDMSAVIDKACSAVGGEGGGHKIAAGATIPIGMEEAFVCAVEEALAASWPRES